jgi:PAS domain S-box-containing protein
MDEPLQPIRLLIVEDNPRDADLMLQELRLVGLDPEWHRVETEAEFSRSLEPEPDLILSDFGMPQFSGLKALELLKKRRLKIPFILVSAMIGEETAVAAMREGAVDYLSKDRLARLGQAVKQALTEKRLRSERDKADDIARELADIVNRARDAIIVRDFETEQITIWNNGAERLYGWTASEAIGRPWSGLIYMDPETRAAFLERLIATGEFSGELKHRTKDGREVIVDSRVTLIRNDDGSPRSVLRINTDITGQKNLEMQLLRAQRLESIGTLASGVAHDLNNVLAPILMASEALRGQLDPAEAAPVLALIEQSARRGRRRGQTSTYFCARNRGREGLDPAQPSRPGNVRHRPADISEIDRDQEPVPGRYLVRRRRSYPVASGFVESRRECA